MKRKQQRRVEAPAADANGLPRWAAVALAAVAAVGLTLLFSPEISDTDFWWHLATGRHIWTTHSLPVPDPFAFTTADAPLAYPAEAQTRRFNLTHEWLAQVAGYAVFRYFGAAGVVAARVGLLLLFCGLAGWVVWRRGRGACRAIAAAGAAGVAVYPFAADRPYLLTFVFTAALFAILDSGNRRAAWAAPAMMLVWANVHGGYVVGLAMLGACVAAGVRERRRIAVLALSACAVLLNPNGLGIFAVLLNYRKSFLTSTLAEWQPWRVWPASAASVLLAAAVVVAGARWRRVRALDAMLLVLFTAAAMVAARNVFLVAWVAPVLLATYAPAIGGLVEDAMLAVAVVAAVAVAVVSSGRTAVQLRVAEWAFPAGAASFLESNGITARMFNTYEYGGYLMWRLWPRERVFIDGRALSEAVFADYGRILYATDANALLDRYGIDAIVMNTFEHTGGTPYTLAPVLAEATDGVWKLVYADAAAVVFLRRPPEGMRVLDGSQVFASMEAECAAHIEHEPDYPGCARALGLMYASTGEPANARRWLGLYLQRHGGADAEASAAFERVTRER